jgi:hypothetical protein
VHVRITLAWHWEGARTRLLYVLFGKTPAGTHVSFTCRGPHCPFRTRAAKRRSLPDLGRRVAGSLFHAGDRVSIRVTAGRRAPELITIRIRHGALPRVRVR